MAFLIPVSILRSQDESTKLFSLTGTWTGTMPCADCEAISYTLNLKRNYTFLDQMTYEGKNVDKLVSDGNWKFLNDSTIELAASSGTKSIYRLLPENQMVMLDDKGDPMPAPSEDMFHLKKSAATGDEMDNSKFLMEEKRKSGVRFLAHGNEPFWSLEIYADNKLKFTSLTEVAEITVPTSKVIPLTDVTGFNYTGTSDSALVNVDIFADECSDDMSGEKFSHRVIVNVQGTLSNIMKSFNGCGHYLYDNDLSRSWKLTKFKKNKLDLDDFENGFPTMNFDLSSASVSGKAGCNSYSGKVEAMDNKIKFGDGFITTRMACPNLEFEQKFLAALKGKHLTYKIADNRLILREGKKFLMELSGVR
ncbi:MAG: copper resistance protein NlpE N-terminal domain-containing protein [Ignavibacteria bacterium]